MDLITGIVGDWGDPLGIDEGNALSEFLAVMASITRYACLVG